MYAPTTLALMITNKCTAGCSHCIVDAKPQGADLSRQTISKVLLDLQKAEIETVLIYGGEPFLHAGKNGLLWHALSGALKSGVQSVQMSSNGFWGKTPQTCREVLGRVNELAKSHGQTVHICLSIDKYHQKKIPVTSLANIVIEHFSGAYENTHLGFSTFVDPESDKQVSELFENCHKNGVCLVTDNRDQFMYPARKEELIECKDEDRTPEQRALLSQTFNCASQFVPNGIPMLVITTLMDFGKLIARKFDAGEGIKNYLIVPERNRIIDYSIEKEVISAGRGRTLNGIGRGQTLKASYARNESDYLIIAPDGNAYKWPAQIAKQIKPVSYEGKSIKALTREMGQLVL